MMSAQRDSRRRLPALPCPAISTETLAPCRLLDGQPAPFPRAGYREPTAALPAFLRGNLTFWRCAGHRCAE